MQSTALSNSHNHDKDANDNCPPFCFCGCCSISISSFEFKSFEIKQVLVHVIPQKISYKGKNFSFNYQGNIWQPPKIA